MLSMGAANLGPNPPSDTNHCPTVCAEIDFSAHRLRFWLVVQAESELSVDLGFVGWVGVLDDSQPQGMRRSHTGGESACVPGALADCEPERCADARRMAGRSRTRASPATRRATRTCTAPTGGAGDPRRAHPDQRRRQRDRQAPRPARPDQHTTGAPRPAGERSVRCATRTCSCFARYVRARSGVAENRRRNPCAEAALQRSTLHQRMRRHCLERASRTPTSSARAT